jgi:hypothetical protein
MSKENLNFTERRMCQANLEMSYSYQSRNVLFSGLRFNGSSSFITMFTKLESPPRMMRWRSVGLFCESQRLLFS